MTRREQIVAILRKWRYEFVHLIDELDVAMELHHAAAILAAVGEATAWRDIAILPDCKYVLLAGKNLDGSDWRDVGVHLGVGRFVDKYGADSHPTHWQPLPPPPPPRDNPSITATRTD